MEWSPGHVPSEWSKEAPPPMEHHTARAKNETQCETIDSTKFISRR